MGAQSRQEQALIEKLSLPFLRDIYIIAMLSGRVAIILCGQSTATDHHGHAKLA